MLLMSIHDYFMGLGVDEIRRRGAEDDKPLRMVKTILHELCKLKVCKLFDGVQTLSNISPHLHK